MAHVKLFESWLGDIASKVKTAFTGDADAAETASQSDSEFKADFTLSAISPNQLSNNLMCCGILY